MHCCPTHPVIKHVVNLLQQKPVPLVLFTIYCLSELCFFVCMRVNACLCFIVIIILPLCLLNKYLVIIYETCCCFLTVVKVCWMTPQVKCCGYKFASLLIRMDLHGGKQSQWWRAMILLPHRFNLKQHLPRLNPGAILDYIQFQVEPKLDIKS